MTDINTAADYASLSLSELFAEADAIGARYFDLEEIEDKGAARLEAEEELDAIIKALGLDD